MPRGEAAAVRQVAVDPFRREKWLDVSFCCPGVSEQCPDHYLGLLKLSPAAQVSARVTAMRFSFGGERKRKTLPDEAKLVYSDCIL